MIKIINIGREMLVQVGIPKQADSYLKSEAFTGVITISNPIVSFWSCFIFVLIPKGQNLKFFFFLFLFLHWNIILGFWSHFSNQTARVLVSRHTSQFLLCHRLFYITTYCTLINKTKQSNCSGPTSNCLPILAKLLILHSYFVV